jgi:hypothetical protein
MDTKGLFLSRLIFNEIRHELFCFSRRMLFVPFINFANICLYLQIMNLSVSIVCKIVKGAL